MLSGEKLEYDNQAAVLQLFRGNSLLMASADSVLSPDFSYVSAFSLINCCRQLAVFKHEELWYEVTGLLRENFRGKQ